jgi:hypothetical protein
MLCQAYTRACSRTSACRAHEMKLVCVVCVYGGRLWVWGCCCCCCCCGGPPAAQGVHLREPRMHACLHANFLNR